jgi:hypothetical protein
MPAPASCREVSRARLRSAIRAWIIPELRRVWTGKTRRIDPALQIMTGSPWPARCPGELARAC